MGRMPDPLQSFHHIPINKQKASEWKKDFSRFDAEFFPWVYPWYHSMNTIFICGNFSSVPLIGPRGCVSYTLTIALR